MRTLCSHCKKGLGSQPPYESDDVVADLCDDCDDRFERTWASMSLGEYLDDVDDPVLVVDTDGRILAANEAMANQLGRVDRRTRGLLGGEVMECKYARLPGGCGKTIHCETCGIRRAVMSTFESGLGRTRIPVQLQRDSGAVPMEISTRRVGPAVFVTIPARAA